MADKGDTSRERAGQKLLGALDDDFNKAIKDPIHDILRRVREGTLTRARAEEWARLHDRPPFASKPASTTFEPRQSRYWTLAQMTAWAVWRTENAVRAVSEEYVSCCVEWIEVGPARVRPVNHDQPGDAFAACGAGYELGSPEVRRANDVLTSARDWMQLKYEPAPFLAPEQTRREILHALKDGDPLVARHGEGEVIDRRLWDVLSPFSLGDGPHDAVFYPSGKKVRFHRVRVERDAVLSVWSAHDEKLQSVSVLSDVDLHLTGAPGRPKAIHVVEDEMRGRATRGECLGSLQTEADALERWFKVAHPTAPSCKSKTIRNQLGPLYRDLVPKKN